MMKCTGYTKAELANAKVFIRNWQTDLRDTVYQMTDDELNTYNRLYIGNPKLTPDDIRKGLLRIIAQKKEEIFLVLEEGLDFMDGR